MSANSGCISGAAYIALGAEPHATMDMDRVVIMYLDEGNGGTTFVFKRHEVWSKERLREERPEDSAVPCSSSFGPGRAKVLMVVLIGGREVLTSQLEIGLPVWDAETRADMKAVASVEYIMGKCS